MHNLVIKPCKKGVEISLDDFVLKGVSEYTLKSSAGRATELSLKLLISSAEFSGDSTANDGSHARKE